jgi:hypothetical protein
MLINPKSIATVLVLTTCLGITIRVANGAELRSSLGQREVSRQLQHQTETVDLEPIYEEGELLEDCDSCDVGCGGCGICDDCLTLRGTWVEAEYLLWWRRGTFTPPLVTTSPLGTPQADAGIDPAIVLFGDQTIGRDAKPGGRITIGHWLGSCHIYSVEGRYFSLGDSTTHFSTNSDINPIIARPFFNTDPAVNANDAELIAFANAAGTVTTGTVDVMDQSEVMGVDVYLRRLWCRTPCWQIDLLAGYQFSRIDESLQFNSFTNDGQGVTLSVRICSPRKTNSTADRSAWKLSFVGAAGPWIYWPSWVWARCRSEWRSVASE